MARLTLQAMMAPGGVMDGASNLTQTLFEAPLRASVIRLQQRQREEDIRREQARFDAELALRQESRQQQAEAARIAGLSQALDDAITLTGPGRSGGSGGSEGGAGGGQLTASQIRLYMQAAGEKVAPLKAEYDTLKSKTYLTGEDRARMQALGAQIGQEEARLAQEILQLQARPAAGPVGPTPAQVELTNRRLGLYGGQPLPSLSQPTTRLSPPAPENPAPTDAPGAPVLAPPRQAQTPLEALGVSITPDEEAPTLQSVLGSLDAGLSPVERMTIRNAQLEREAEQKQEQVTLAEEAVDSARADLNSLNAALSHQRALKAARERTSGLPTPYPQQVVGLLLQRDAAQALWAAAQRRKEEAEHQLRLTQQSISGRAIGTEVVRTDPATGEARSLSLQTQQVGTPAGVRILLSAPQK